MFTLKVGTAEQYQDIEQGETRLRVPFQILDADGQVATERIESFPLTVKVLEVKETLKRHLDVYTEDHQRYEAGKEHQAHLDQSQDVADKISGLTL
jgi:hypothetical protein